MESLPLEVGIPAVSRSQVTSLSGPYPGIAGTACDFSDVIALHVNPSS